jgi:hypothetical protein
MSVTGLELREVKFVVCPKCGAEQPFALYGSVAFPHFKGCPKVEPADSDTRSP